MFTNQQQVSNKASVRSSTHKTWLPQWWADDSVVSRGSVFPWEPWLCSPFQCSGQLDSTELPRMMRINGPYSHFPKMCPWCREDVSCPSLRPCGRTRFSQFPEGSPRPSCCCPLGWTGRRGCVFPVTATSWGRLMGCGTWWEAIPSRQYNSWGQCRAAFHQPHFCGLSFEPRYGVNSSFWPQNEK